MDRSRGKLPYNQPDANPLHAEDRDGHARRRMRSSSFIFPSYNTGALSRFQRYRALVTI
jgi:hypothetical protein